MATKSISIPADAFVDIAEFDLDGDEWDRGEADAGDAPVLSDDESRPDPIAPARKRRSAAKGKQLVKLAPPKRGDRLAIVPDYSRFESYEGRQIDGVDWTKMMDTAREHRWNVLIEGPTGSGKTHMIEAYAALRQLPFYSISSSVAIEPSQLFGKFIPNPAEARTLMWQDGPVTDIFRHGGVLLINEVNFIPARISTVLFPALDYRRVLTLTDHKGEVITAHENLLIVADMNPGYHGTQELNAAFRNRFTIQVPWGYDKSVETKMVQSPALLKMVEAVRNDSAAESVATPVGTNMLKEFEAIVVHTGSVPFAMANFINHFAQHERLTVKRIAETFMGNLVGDYKKLDII